MVSLGFHVIFLLYFVVCLCATAAGTGLSWTAAALPLLENSTSILPITKAESTGFSLLRHTNFDDAKINAIFLNLFRFMGCGFLTRWCFIRSCSSWNTSGKNWKKESRLCYRYPVYCWLGHNCYCKNRKIVVCSPLFYW